MLHHGIPLSRDRKRLQIKRFAAAAVFIAAAAAVVVVVTMPRASIGGATPPWLRTDAARDAAVAAARRAVRAHLEQTGARVTGWTEPSASLNGQRYTVRGEAVAQYLTGPPARMTYQAVMTPGRGESWQALEVVTGEARRKPAADASN